MEAGAYSEWVGGGMSDLATDIKKSIEGHKDWPKSLGVFAENMSSFYGSIEYVNVHGQLRYEPSEPDFGLASIKVAYGIILDCLVNIKDLESFTIETMGGKALSIRFEFSSFVQLRPPMASPTPKT
jgi:hypothetical protein